MQAARRRLGTKGDAPSRPSPPLKTKEGPSRVLVPRRRRALRRVVPEAGEDAAAVAEENNLGDKASKCPSRRRRALVRQNGSARCTWLGVLENSVGRGGLESGSGEGTNRLTQWKPPRGRIVRASRSRLGYDAEAQRNVDVLLTQVPTSCSHFGAVDATSMLRDILAGQEARCRKIQTPSEIGCNWATSLASI